MYAAPISEEDSFLPAILWSNPTEQLKHVRGYYERQREHNLVLHRNLEDIRMSYSMKLCSERNRLSKSLWELEVRKRRLLHQIIDPQAKRSSDWRRKSVSQAKKQQKGKEEGDLVETGRTNKRTSTKRKEGKQEKKIQVKPKTETGEKSESEQLEIPKYLLQ
ncbi:hypothetical protein ACROYT_G039543 [Oculina patagonica]